MGLGLDRSFCEGGFEVVDTRACGVSAGDRAWDAGLLLYEGIFTIAGRDAALVTRLRLSLNEPAMAEPPSSFLTWGAADASLGFVWLELEAGMFDLSHLDPRPGISGYELRVAAPPRFEFSLLKEVADALDVRLSGIASCPVPCFEAAAGVPCFEDFFSKLVLYFSLNDDCRCRPLIEGNAFA